MNSKKSYEALEKILTNELNMTDTIKYLNRLEMGITGPVMKAPIQPNYKRQSN